MCYLTDIHNKKVSQIKTETVKEFLMRGGNVISIKNVKSIKNKKISAQALVDNASPEVMAEVIKFLKTQNIEVQ